MCWGLGFNGQLGNGTGSLPGPMSSPPVNVADLTNVSALAEGAVHACALLATGDVACWGYDVDGELANTTASPSYNSTPLPVQW